MNMLRNTLNNENGSVLFIAVLILLVATMIGFFATQNATIEIQIAGNQRVYQRAFYRADAASMEGAQRLFNEARYHDGDRFKDNNLFPSWFYPKAQTASLEDISNWVNNGGALGQYHDIDTTDGANDANKDPAFAIAYQSVAPGAQWEMGQPTDHLLAIFGLFDPTNTNEQVFLSSGFIVEY